MPGRCDEFLNEIPKDLFAQEPQFEFDLCVWGVHGGYGIMNSPSRPPPVSPFAIEERTSGENDHDQENASPKPHALGYPIRLCRHRT